MGIATLRLRASPPAGPTTLRRSPPAEPDKQVPRTEIGPLVAMLDAKTPDPKSCLIMVPFRSSGRVFRLNHDLRHPALGPTECPASFAFLDDQRRVLDDIVRRYLSRGRRHLCEAAVAQFRAFVLQHRWRARQSSFFRRSRFRVVQRRTAVFLLAPTRQRDPVRQAKRHRGTRRADYSTSSSPSASVHSQSE